MTSSIAATTPSPPAVTPTAGKDATAQTASFAGGDFQTFLKMLTT